MKSSSQTTSTKCQYHDTAFEAEVVVGLEVAGDAPEEDHDEHRHAERHVESVEAREHEERGPEDAARELEVQFEYACEYS
jgi:hypothetical protein